MHTCQGNISSLFVLFKLTLHSKDSIENSITRGLKRPAEHSDTELEHSALMTESASEDLEFGTSGRSRGKGVPKSPSRKQGLGAYMERNAQSRALVSQSKVKKIAQQTLLIEQDIIDRQARRQQDAARFEFEMELKRQSATNDFVIRQRELDLREKELQQVAAQLEFNSRMMKFDKA